MKPRVSHLKTAALTLVEVFVVIVVLVILAALFFPALARPKRDRGPWCFMNLKQIKLAYIVWASDHGDKYPMQLSTANWGAKELALNRDVAGIFCTMSNELSTPKYLLCPQDKYRTAATNFAANFSAKNISYFVGLDAERRGRPQTFLSGDDNLAISGVPVKSGLLELPTNAAIAWTEERHFFTGNIGFADGSVVMLTGSSLTNFLHQTGVATNRLAIP